MDPQQRMTRRLRVAASQSAVRLDFLPKPIGWVGGTMSKNEAGFAIADKVLKAAKIRHEHDTTVRHRFQQREPK